MNDIMYEMIFKRKSFHKFKKESLIPINDEEISLIKDYLANVPCLDNSIKWDYEIVKEEFTTCKANGEYCLLFYSETKDNYLQNIGFIGEYLDLYLTSLNIGTCWYGMAKPDNKKKNNLDYVIMISFAKVSIDLFRKDLSKIKRKEVEQTWIINKFKGISDIVRYAPSAINMQPWLVEYQNNDIKVYRYKKDGIHGLMPDALVNHYNRIDIGIYLCFIEICMHYLNIEFTKELIADDGSIKDKALNMIYHLK